MHAEMYYDYALIWMSCSQNQEWSAPVCSFSD